ncbi:MAG: 50S ribosomal protein L18 [Nitrospinae bacterium]|nr:50S ribosomal protein L18 [Nitrospinota bacterium]
MLKRRSDRRILRKKRVRKRIIGTSERPRVSVFRSLRHIYAQIIDDLSGRTIVSASTLDKELNGKINNGGNVEASKLVGEILAERALKNHISNVVFDRDGFLYHGRVKALAMGMRERGIKF